LSVQPEAVGDRGRLTTSGHAELRQDLACSAEVITWSAMCAAMPRVVVVHLDLAGVQPRPMWISNEEQFLLSAANDLG
jgi:hypothetical protein